MSRHGYGHHGGGSLEGAMGGLLALAVWLAILLLIVLAAASMFIGKTFSRYHKVSKGLWYSLYIALALAIIGAVLYVVNHYFISLQQLPAIAEGLWGTAFLELLVVASVINRKYSSTLMKPSINVIEELQKNAFWRKP